MKHIITVFLFYFSVLAAFASNGDHALEYETITLKGGLKVAGYIMAQSASDDFSFMLARQPEIPDSCVSDSEIYVAVADSVVDASDSVVEIVDNPYSFIEEIVSYPAEISLKWDDVEYIERNTSIGGIQDIIVLGDNTEYIGYITRNNPVKGISFISSDNKKMKFDWDKIVAYNRCALEQDSSILRQSPIISTYTFAGSKPLVGLIVEQDYETGLITIETEDGAIQRNSARLVNIQSVPNDNLYTPKRKAKRPGRQKTQLKKIADRIRH